MGFSLALLQLCQAARENSPGLVAFSASAQRSPSYVNAWGGIRGANYVPSYAKNSAEAWTDYDRTVVEREISWAQRLGFNALRFFLSMLAWCEDPDTFRADLDHLLRTAAVRGVKLLLVLFDDDFIEAPGLKPRSASDPGQLRAEIARWVRTRRYRNLTRWFASPGRFVLEVDARSTPRWALSEKYLTSVAALVRERAAAVLGVDVMNEPNRCARSGRGPDNFNRSVRFVRSCFRKCMSIRVCM